MISVFKNHIKILLIIYLFFLLPGLGYSQGFLISGKVLEKLSGELLPGATVTLRSQEDSLLIAGAVTDTAGMFELRSVSKGEYLLEISFIGFYPIERKLTVTSENIRLDSLLLEPSEILLDEVTVRTRQPTLVNKLDKKVYNVQEDILAESGSVSDILQHIPSISVDIDGNITLRNSGNITFFMNGRPSSMLRRNAASVLQQMPANNIERIEIITNPSARYRPDGVGGIINIVMKKETQDELTGQVSANAGSEKRYNANMNLNYGTGEMKLFGNYGIRHNSGTRLFTDERVYYDPENGSVSSDYHETGSSSSNGLAHNLFAGGSYEFNDFNTLELTSSLFLQNTYHESVSEIAATDSAGNPEYNFTDRSTNDEFEKEGEMSLAFEHRFRDNEDHTLSFEAAYSGYDESEDQEYAEEYTYPDDRIEITGNLVEKNGNQQEILFDHTLPFGEDGEFESGYAAEFVQEDIRYAGEASTSRFLLNQQVHALYALVGMPIENFSFKIGARAEQAIIDSRVKFPVDSLTHNRYFKIYPTLHLGYELNSNNDLSVSYSKRINRPDADELNPYPEYSDPRNAEAGNPNLKPEQIHSIELGYQWSHSLAQVTSTLFYRYEYDAFTTIYSTISDSVVLRTISNLNTQRSLGYEIVFTGHFVKNWELNLTGSVFQTTLDASDLGYSSNKSTVSGNIKVYTQLNLWKSTFFQVNGFYYFPTITPQGKREPYYYINAGFKQQLFRNRASLILTASDILHTYRIRYRIESDELDRFTTSKRKYPVIYLGFVWRFNNYRDQQKLEYEGEGLVY